MASVILGILLVFVPLPLSAEAQTRGNLTSGSSLTANDRNSSLLSPSGEFAFGFRRMGRGAHLLAIWFEKIEDKTIVWSANDGMLAPEGSKIQLTADGRLVLADPRGGELWSPSLTGVEHAAMLDTGNFVLVGQNSVNLWETFSQPTDTMLPTQQLDQGTKVSARYSEMNYSSGRFNFILQADGNLVFYATPYSGDFSDTYWDSKTVGSGFRLIFNQSGQVYLTARNGTILNSITSGTVPTGGFYHRAILEYDGVFRQYVHPKTANSSSGWTMISSPIPPNICTSIRQNFGSGACGFNSYCVLGDDKRPQCRCPPRYTPLDTTNEMKGCRQDFEPQSCDGSRPETDQFDLREMPDTNWPMYDYQRTPGTTEDWCREACLADCFCALVIFGGGVCWKKKIPLSNGMMLPRGDSEGTKALIKTNHKNLVQLLGYCNEGQHRLLVYEFMSNGTLANFLFGASRPSWYRRIEIACDVARGLSYLHDDCTRRIIHCDIKPQNILLDGSLTAKISDFGLAKLLMANQTRTTTGVKGTRGYLAPEWFRNLPISSKIDVYSFGILLVELICCRKNYEPGAEIEAQIVLADWMYDCYQEGSVHLLVESDEEASSDIKRVKRFVMTALWCIQEDPALRPSMKNITQMLEGVVEVPVPQVPSSSIISI
ncbi:hypothetical protein BT93_C2340 [Corymbia citriodora subsp. variegata]|nr:hypothetical protein BT93_C2340 [Corymbia citriodora subsp. variegata]